MSSFTAWLSVTIFGFVYVAAAFFLVLWIAGEKDLNFLKNCQQYSPYLAIIAVSLSYVVGLAAHFVSDYVWTKWLCPSDAKSAGDLLSLRERTTPYLLEQLGRTYDTLVLLRHLFLAFFMLFITSNGWLRTNHSRKLTWAVAIVCLCAAVFFFLAWQVQRGLYIDFRDAIMNK